MVPMYNLVTPLPWRLSRDASPVTPLSWRLSRDASPVTPLPWRLSRDASPVTPLPWRLSRDASLVTPLSWRLSRDASPWQPSIPLTQSCNVVQNFIYLPRSLTRSTTFRHSPLLHCRCGQPDLLQIVFLPPQKMYVLLRNDCICKEKHASISAVGCIGRLDSSQWERASVFWCFFPLRCSISSHGATWHSPEIRQPDWPVVICLGERSVCFALWFHEFKRS